MRKKSIIAIALLLLASLPLVACSKKTKTTKDTKVTTAKPTTTEHVHEFGEWQEQSKATCSEEGYRRRKCSSCGFYEYEIIPRVEHTFVDGKCTVCGYELISEGFNITYSDLDGLYHIDDYTGTETTVRIPRTYDDGEHGDRNIYIDREVVNGAILCKMRNCNIKKIVIGAGFDKIDDYMFAGLSSLEEVVIDSNVLKIGNNAFYSCSNLSKITFNDDLEQIGMYAFASCAFEEIKLPYFLEVIDTGAFSDNVNLTSISYYNNVTEIGDNALSNTALTSIKISYGITYFGYQAKLPNVTTFNVDGRNSKYEFEDGCLINVESNVLMKALEPITTIPDTIKTLGSYSLAYLDYSEVDFVVPNSIKEINFAAFYGSTFKSLTIGNGITLLNEMVFGEVEIVDDGQLILPNTITEIVTRAFLGLKCKEVTVPASVTIVDYSIFEDCLVEEIKIYKNTVYSDDCDYYWDLGIDTDYTTITIIDDTD